MKSPKLCECGCGHPVIEMAKQTRYGNVAGYPLRFIRGHGKRTTSDWTVNFWKHVQKTDTCWNWTGSRQRDGYGVFRVNRVVGGFGGCAHRIAYELLIGPIPEGLTLDHECKNTSCVNPAHLKPMTQLENLLRGDTVNAMNASKTHCKHGHEFNAANTYIRKPQGSRVCRQCGKDANRRRTQKLQKERG